MENIRTALTFDDVLLVPAASSVMPRDVDLRTQLTQEISLGIPVLSAAMDTVTEHRMAISLAQEGGLGIIHKNFTPAEQAHQVSKVKKYEAGIINDPITVAPNMSIGEVIELTHRKKISGVPVVDGDQLVGIVTSRDLRYPDACKDSTGRLRVGAAVGVGADSEERVAGLVQAGVDVLVVDTAHGHSKGVIDRVALIKKEYPDIQVIGGNIATAQAAMDLVQAKFQQFMMLRKR